MWLHQRLKNDVRRDQQQRTERSSAAQTSALKMDLVLASSQTPYKEMQPELHRASPFPADAHGRSSFPPFLRLNSLLLQRNTSNFSLEGSDHLIPFFSETSLDPRWMWFGSLLVLELMAQLGFVQYLGEVVSRIHPSNLFSAIKVRLGFRGRGHSDILSVPQPALRSKFLEKLCVFDAVQ